MVVGGKLSTGKLIGRSRIQTNSVQKTALTRLGKRRTVFHFRNRSGGWMFAINIMVEVMAA